MKIKIIIVLLLCVGLHNVSAQTGKYADATHISLNAAIGRAMNNCPSIRAAQLDVKSKQALVRTAYDIGSTQITTGGDEIGKGTDGKYTLFSIRQDFDVLNIGSRKKVRQQMAAISQSALSLSERELEREVSISYSDAFTAMKQYQLSLRTDSLYKDFERAARLRYDTQATSKLEYLSAQSQARQSEINSENARRDYVIALQNLNHWFASDTIFTVEDTDIVNSEIAVGEASTVKVNHPLLQMSQQQVSLAEAEYRLQKSAFMPKLFAEYGSQKIGSVSGYYSYQVGISVPLVFGAQSARVKSARIDGEIARENYRQRQSEVNNAYRILRDEYLKWESTCRYYSQTAVPVAREQQAGAMKAYREGAADYLSFIQNTRDALQIESDYLKAFDSMLDAKYKLEFFNK